MKILVQTDEPPTKEQDQNDKNVINNAIKL